MLDRVPRRRRAQCACSVSLGGDSLRRCHLLIPFPPLLPLFCRPSGGVVCLQPTPLTECLSAGQSGTAVWLDDALLPLCSKGRRRPIPGRRWKHFASRAVLSQRKLHICWQGGGRWQTGCQAGWTTELRGLDGMTCRDDGGFKMGLHTARALDAAMFSTFSFYLM